MAETVTTLRRRLRQTLRQAVLQILTQKRYRSGRRLPR
jgi:hypothetical protein